VRLRWETPTPAATARIWQALGVSVTAEHDRLDAVLDGATAELVAGPGPRLSLLEDVAPPTGAAEPASLRVGIASVDAERYARERGWAISALPQDSLLGAFVWRVVEFPAFVLLEPNTEGRLAGTLARHAEGPAALYVRPVARTLDEARRQLRAGAIPATDLADGPFGREFIVVDGPVAGPHLIAWGT
jgi:hypothetical protein